MVAENIKKLRMGLGKSQSEMANEMGLNRSTLAGYEAGSNEPNIERLKNLASYFKVSVDELIYNSDKKFLGNKDSFKILTISIDKHNKENIELVPAKVRAGYLTGYKDPEYISKLPKFNLPNLPQGTFRAFEISGDSMLPINDGSIVLGKYIKELSELKDNIRYILVTKDDGIVFKRIIKSAKNTILLCSDNPAYSPYSINFDTIIEMWTFHAFIGYPKKENDINIKDIVIRLNNIDNKLNKLLT